MKKTLFILFGLIGFITISVSFTTFDPPGYKNLKILPNDISKEALDSVMHNYCMSLGVRCGFCHVHNEETKKWDMASDDNPYKLIARKMMLMKNDINAKFFPGEKGNTDQQAIQTITCYTCHKGEAIPVAVAPPMKEEEHK